MTGTPTLLEFQPNTVKETSFDFGGFYRLMKMQDRRIPAALLKLIVLAGLLFGVGACTKVEPGYVGIKVNNWGSQKGVQDYPLKTGMVFYNPLTEDMYDFPTFMV